jgi:hypothetical protein
MSKADYLDLIKLLSALESWGLGGGHHIPDYLIERLDGAMEKLTQEVLEK